MSEMTRERTPTASLGSKLLLSSGALVALVSALATLTAFAPAAEKPVLTTVAALDAAIAIALVTAAKSRRSRGEAIAFGVLALALLLIGSDIVRRLILRG